MRCYFVAYDISSDHRRRKTAELLEGDGERVQYSVFECLLDNRCYLQLQQQLRRHFDLSEDHIRLYPMTRHTLDRLEI